MQWVPVPELAEQNHTHDCTSIFPTHMALKTDSDVVTTSINESLIKSGIETSHEIFMFIRDDLVIQGTGEVRDAEEALDCCK